MKVENGSVPDSLVKEKPDKIDWSRLTVAQRFDLQVKRAIIREEERKSEIPKTPS